MNPTRVSETIVQEIAIKGSAEPIFEALTNPGQRRPCGCPGNFINLGFFDLDTNGVSDVSREPERGQLPVGTDVLTSPRRIRSVLSTIEVGRPMCSASLTS